MLELQPTIELQQFPPAKFTKVEEDQSTGHQRFSKTRVFFIASIVFVTCFLGYCLYRTIILIWVSPFYWYAQTNTHTRKPAYLGSLKMLVVGFLLGLLSQASIQRVVISPDGLGVINMINLTGIGNYFVEFRWNLQQVVRLYVDEISRTRRFKL